jgi:hypothetical protein
MQKTLKKLHALKNNKGSQLGGAGIIEAQCVFTKHILFNRVRDIKYGHGVYINMIFQIKLLMFKS